MQKKRTTNFREDETKLLIQLWGSPSIQTQMSACHRKAPIMIQLASMMQQYGFYRTPEEITTRIRNLKCIYHRIKKTLRTGFITDPDWHHFKAMDAILGDGMAAHRYNIGMDGFPRREIKTELVDVEDIINSKYNNDSHRYYKKCCLFLMFIDFGTAVEIQVEVFGVMTPCKCCGKIPAFQRSMVTPSSELVSYHSTTRRHNSEDVDLNFRSCEIQKSRKCGNVWFMCRLQY
jgi:hypothetical protein